MRLTRRNALGVIGSTLAMPRAALAAEWPTKVIRVLVPFPPGGAIDAIARLLGNSLSPLLGQAIVIENRPGAGGNIGAEAAAKAAGDGHTLLMVSIGHAVNRFLYERLTYDPVADFVPVSLIGIVPNILVVHPSVPAQTVQELIAYAKANPGQLHYASAGVGTSIHLAGALFSRMAGIDMVHVPYRGSSPAAADLLAGRVQVMFDSITASWPHVRSGKLRALAVTTDKRSSTAPDVPTIAEAGVEGYDVSPWFAMFAPKGTPEAVVDRLYRAIVVAMLGSEIRARFAEIGVEPVASAPGELAAHLAKESQKWGDLINAAGIKASD